MENDGWAREGPGSHGNVPTTSGQRNRSSGGRHRGKDVAVDEKRQTVGGETVGLGLMIVVRRLENK